MEADRPRDSNAPPGICLIFERIDMNCLELINDVLWKVLKKSLWFRAEKSARATLKPMSQRYATSFGTQRGAIRLGSG